MLFSLDDLLYGSFLSVIWISAHILPLQKSPDLPIQNNLTQTSHFNASRYLLLSVIFFIPLLVYYITSLKYEFLGKSRTYYILLTAAPMLRTLLLLVGRGLEVSLSGRAFT